MSVKSVVESVKYHHASMRHLGGVRLIDAHTTVAYIRDVTLHIHPHKCQKRPSNSPARELKRPIDNAKETY